MAITQQQLDQAHGRFPWVEMTTLFLTIQIGQRSHALQRIV